jgi:hypothetical protein
MGGASGVYVIWYGCWQDDCGTRGSSVTTGLIADFTSSIGGTPYFQLNHLYPGGSGNAPSGGLLYAGSIFDRSYSHGLDLTKVGIEDLVRQHIENNDLPEDPSGIYIVIASADVSSNTTGFCSLVNTPPLHGTSTAFGSQAKYGFIGNPVRCPSLEAPQFVKADGTLLPTPNGDFAADSIASNLARVLNNIVSNPHGSAWYDRYGLETADKCWNTFGATYTTANEARANVRWGGRDYLIQQNWVNDRKGRCAMQWTP